MPEREVIENWEEELADARAGKFNIDVLRGMRDIGDQQAYGLVGTNAVEVDRLRGPAERDLAQRCLESCLKGQSSFKDDETGWTYGELLLWLLEGGLVTATYLRVSPKSLALIRQETSERQAHDVLWLYLSSEEIPLRDAQKCLAFIDAGDVVVPAKFPARLVEEVRLKAAQALLEGSGWIFSDNHVAQLVAFLRHESAFPARIDMIDTMEEYSMRHGEETRVAIDLAHLSFVRRAQLYDQASLTPQDRQVWENRLPR
jgi:hypothetical protein